MTFLPHLLRLLGRRGIRAKLVFARLDDPAADRKVLARQLHSLVLSLKPIADYIPQRDERRAGPSQGRSGAKSTMTCGAGLAGPILD